MSSICPPAPAPRGESDRLDSRRAYRAIIPGVGNQIIVYLLQLIARRGGDEQTILRANGFHQPLDLFLRDILPTLDDTSVQRLSSRIMVAVGDMQARAVGRPTFRGGDWRLLFFCLVGSRTLREAITRMEEFLEAIDGRLGWVTHKCSATMTRFTYGGVRSGDEELDFIVILHGYLMFHAVFSWLIGKPLDGTMMMDFDERRRGYLSEEELPFTLVLGADRLELSFASRLIDQPIIRTMEDCEALPSLNFLFGSRAGSDPQEIVRRSRRIMAMTLKMKRELPSLDELAGELALSRMTLRRRLQAAGTSFNAVRDELRQEMAIDLLTNSQMPIEQVAERLDFCDSDAFRRAFRSWTGMAPTEFRRDVWERASGR